MSEVARDTWFVMEIHKKQGKWVSIGFVSMSNGTVVKFETSGRTPDEAQAWLEQCIVSELMQRERVGRGRRAYDDQRSFLDAPYEAPIEDMGRRREDRGL